MLKKIVIALGGNALGNTPEEQLELVARTAKPIVDLIEQGNQVVIAHGNGPQVGMINLGMSSAAQANVIRAPMPFPECAAMSQGYIGFHLQNRIGNELAARGLKKEIVTLVTQVLVNEDDPGFSNPTKPIGSFYSREDAKRIEAEKGYRMVEDGGRGYRRVVPSPKPVDVIEKETVAELMESGSIVITVGGGGIPVIRKEGKLEGIAAVIDKDFASAKLAELIHADMLFILTAVDRVAINWGKPDQKELAQMTIREAEQYCREGHFAPGSMLPKVQAAVSFAKTGGTATIASLDKAVLALKGISGTRIIA
ncbi:carbamate kinase [Enterocloster aldenensis]|uniref:carbamate kinase n=1 Tax=Enterocloster aldenensis TaxID=358742 RepID=UPI000E486E6D|nr:carbamate kinase [Enterocloster aldenensis]